MNIILIDKNDHIDGTGTVRISGRRFTHIKKVLSPEEGDILKCGELGGLLGSAEVLDINEKHIDMKVTLSEEPPEKIPVTVILALPRPKALKRILQNMTSLGVKRVILINAARVEKSYWQSPALKESCIREQLILGLEQARDTVLPEVRSFRSFKVFVEDELPDMVKGTRAILAHPASDRTFPEASSGVFTLVVGPEGGFTPYEIEELSGCGCEQVSLGKRILKTETAVTVMIAKAVG